MNGHPKSMYQVMQPKIPKCTAITLSEGLSTGDCVTARHQEMRFPSRLETATIFLGIHLVAIEEHPYRKSPFSNPGARSGGTLMSPICQYGKAISVIEAMEGSLHIEEICN